MSMLPATWKDHEPPQIVDDLARSLASMVGADIVGTTALAGDDASSLRLAFASSDVGDRADYNQIGRCTRGGHSSGDCDRRRRSDQ
jgi:hypothetical protein